MKFPYVVEKELAPNSLREWHNVFLPTKGTRNDKTIEQSLWRRNQTKANKEVSGWKTDSDNARKIVYYKHTYNTQEANNITSLILESTYVYVCLTLKKNELDKYIKKIHGGLETAGWKKTSNGYKYGDLLLELKHYSNPNKRFGEYINYSDDYETLEIKMMSYNFEETLEQKLIWNIAKAGLRKSKKRNNPKYATAKDLIAHFPAQIELGCGPSYEAGVDPLHTLHEIYSINEPFTKKFIIDAENDSFVINLVAEPEATLVKTSKFYSKILTAELTDFYLILKKLYDKELIVGPILTNNFDGLHLRVGLPEIFIRTYDEVDVLPQMKFDSRAKSLLVIGCHADRRGIERRARERGLKVMYIDPEGWWVDDEFIDYPLESPQELDLILKEPSSKAFKLIENELQLKKLI